MFEPIVGERIPVTFAGPGAGTAPLTWGQLAIVRGTRETGWSHNLSGTHPLPDGMTAEDVAAQMRDLMNTYPALRMRLGAGGQSQVVAESGETSLDVVDLADDADPADAVIYAERLRLARRLAPSDAYHDWPMRTAVIRHRGHALHRVLTFQHLVVDGTAVALLLADLGMGDLAGRRARDPRTPQILELARREQTPQLRQVSDRAMRYWSTRLRSIPPLTFGEPTHPQGRLGERYWRGRFHSRAAHLAVLAIAKRTGANTSNVLHAVIAIAIGRATGVDSLTAKVVVANRFRPGFAEVIAPLSQNSLVSVDVADTTVDDVVARTRRASVASGMHAYYDPEQLAALTERLDRERGYPARVSCRFNDRRIHSRREAEGAVHTEEVTPARIRAALDETRLVWEGVLNTHPEQFLINVEDRPDTVLLEWIFDLASFTEEQVERVLRGVEEVAIEAAFDHAAPTRVGSGRLIG